jgi:hypothetical protein
VQRIALRVFLALSLVVGQAGAIVHAYSHLEAGHLAHGVTDATPDGCALDADEHASNAHACDLCAAYASADASLPGHAAHEPPLRRADPSTARANAAYSKRAELAASIRAPPVLLSS